MRTPQVVFCPVLGWIFSITSFVFNWCARNFKCVKALLKRVALKSFNMFANSTRFWSHHFFSADIKTALWANINLKKTTHRHKLETILYREWCLLYDFRLMISLFRAIWFAWGIQTIFGQQIWGTCDTQFDWLLWRLGLALLNWLSIQFLPI